MVRMSRVLGRIRSLLSRRSIRLQEKKATPAKPLFELKGSRAREVDYSLREYQLFYQLDEVIFYLVNSTVEDITGQGFYFQPVDESEKAVEYAREFEKWSRRVNLQRMLEEIVFDTVLTGNGIQYIVYNKGMTEILGFIPLVPDFPNKIDFIRDSNRNIVLDEWGRPKGYVVKSNLTDEVELPRRFFVHTTLYTFPRGFIGISPIKPLVKKSLIKMNIEDSYGEGVFREGYPFYLVYVGNESYPTPTEEELEKIEEAMLSTDTGDEVRVGVMLPYWVRVEKSEPARVSEISETLEYFQKSQYIPFRMSTAEARSRVVAEALRSDYERHIGCLQNRIASQIQEQVIQRRAEVAGMDLDYVPEFKFIGLSATIRLSRARRIATLARYSLITPDMGLENTLRREEGLPPISREDWLQSRVEKEERL